MKQSGKLQGLVFLLLAAVPLSLALAACAGADGENGQDLTVQTAKLHGTFDADIKTLFWTNDVFFDGSLSCLKCHYGTAPTTAFHAISFNDYSGFLKGPTDAAPLGEDMWGRSDGAGTPCPDLTSVSAPNCIPNWGESAMRGRLRNTRMPPGWAFDLNQGNRDTVEVLAITAWLRDGGTDAAAASTVAYQTLLADLRLDDGDGTIKEGGTIPVGTLQPITWTKEAIDSTFPGSLTMADLFKESNIFFLGSQACTECHGDPTLGFSWHALNMTSYVGILNGPQDGGFANVEDLMGRPAGCDLTLESVDVADGCVPVPGDSALRRRMRNTRMPPGWPFQLGQGNRAMWAIEQIGNWVSAGMPNGSF